MAGYIQLLTESSDLAQSASLLKTILLRFEALAEGNEIARGRMPVIYEKMSSAMVAKLAVGALRPRDLANISTVGQKYTIVDQALSFYSNFISAMEERGEGQGTRREEMVGIMEQAQHTRDVLVNLLQVYSRRCR